MSLPNHQAPMLPSATRLRQIALVAEDLDKARYLLTTVIGTEVIFEDPAVGQWGLKNILVPVGGDIIEVVSPFRSDTAASRQLSKRGDSGYMIIMQTLNANARKEYIEANNLAKVIFCHESKDSICIQYHPKGIKGGVIPELDSHNHSTAHPEPLTERFSPWHAVGPPSSYPTYSAGMKRHGDLRLLSAVLRLTSGDHDISAAAKQWEVIFGIPKGKRQGELDFTNANLKFAPGQQGKSEGITKIVIGVDGRDRLDSIHARATEERLNVDDEGCVEVLGVKWKFLLLGEAEQAGRSRL